jgi:hypothetical protein
MQPVIQEINNITNYGKLGREGTIGCVSGALGGPQPPFIFRMVRAFLTRRVFLRFVRVFLIGIIYYKKTIIYNLVYKFKCYLKSRAN